MAETPKENPINSYEELKKTFESLGSPVGKILDAIDGMAKAADAINNSFIAGRTRLDEMNDAAARSAAGIIRLGGSIADVSTTIVGIAEGSKRQFIATEDQVSKLYAATEILGGTSAGLVNTFGEVGIEISQIGKSLEDSIEYIQSVGLNAKSVMQDVTNSMSQMNRFQFDGGVQGLTKMAAQASMLRFDMKETFQFAEKVLTPDGAIETAAGIQRLGISIGNLADPFALMNASINDPSGLQDSLIKATKQFTEFDEKTKTFKINPQGMLTLRELAKETNTSFENLSKSALAAADLDKRVSKINPTLTFDSPEDKQFIANMATMTKEGDYVVQLKNDETGIVETKKLGELTQDELAKLREQQEKAPKTLEDIQKSQLNALLDIKYAIEGNIAKGTYGLAGSSVVRGTIAGAERISRAVTSSVDTAVPESVAITEKVNEAIEKMSALFIEKDSNKISSDDFAKKLSSLQNTILKDANSLGEKGKEAFKDILEDSSKKVTGSSAIEKEFRSLTQELLASVGRPVKATEQIKARDEEQKSLSYADIIGRRNQNLTDKTGTSSNSGTSTNKVDVGGTITFKFDLPAGTTLNQQQLNAVFNSEEFKQYIANLAKQNSSEKKGSGAPYYGR
jgi:hypothetical protein